MKKKLGIAVGLAVLALIIGVWNFSQPTKSSEAYSSTETVADEDQATSQETAQPLPTGKLEEIDQILENGEFSGVSLITKAGEVFDSQSYGYADFQNLVENTSDLSFPVASIQKTLTGILIAQLVASGQLSYDETLADFYPEVEESSAITIRMLLNQTSGIQMAEIAPDETLTTQAAQLDYVLESLDSTTDFDFYYTNANYSLLAGIISQLTGEDYEQVLTERIIQPLNLTGTYFWDTLPESLQIPNPYYDDLELGAYTDYGPQIQLEQPLFSSLLGAGNLLMTAEDLLKVQTALGNHTLLSQSDFENLLASDSGYSAGYWLGDELISIGMLGAYTSVIYTDQSFSNIVILLENQAGESDLSVMAEEIAEVVAN